MRAVRRPDLGPKELIRGADRVVVIASDHGHIIDLPHDPKRLVRSAFRATLGVEGHLLMEVNIVGQEKDLLDKRSPSASLIKHAIVEHDDSLCIYPACGRATPDEVVEIEESDEGAFTLA
ncbi:hypothetical protein G6F59_016581 [Rhizopus arrhizus]|nr:hypothetical protein G6F59_016581 [Rhizopus arrhizus]